MAVNTQFHNMFNQQKLYIFSWYCKCKQKLSQLKTFMRRTQGRHLSLSIGNISFHTTKSSNQMTTFLIITRSNGFQICTKQTINTALQSGRPYMEDKINSNKLKPKQVNYFQFQLFQSLMIQTTSIYCLITIKTSIFT